MLKQQLSEEQLLSRVAEWRSAGLKIGFTCGAFDVLHAGHVDYLQKARELCDRLIVAVNSDHSIHVYKGLLRPIVAEEHRLFVISSLSCVDAVILMNDTRPARLIGLLQPDIYVKGGDYRSEQLRSASVVESYGGRCTVLPIEYKISTTQIIHRILELSTHATAKAPSYQALSGLILLDRDGTLIDNVSFLKDPDRVRLRPGVGEGLRLLQDAGFGLVIITNQQGIGLGYFDYDDFVAVNSEMLRQLAPFGVRISRFYFCPHSVAENCNCRKPGIELIQRAVADFGCRTENCYLLGDSISDLQAAKSAGCKGILVGIPHSSDREPSRPSFIEAAHEIVDLEVGR